MAIITSPPNSAVDTEGENPTVNQEWRNFFVAAYNICNAITQSGTTAQRPTALLWAGRPYFDTTLGKPIWYKTAGWVDATGASV